MFSYVIRRLLLLIPTVLVMSFLIFLLVGLIPGDIIDMMRGADPEAEIDRALVERQLGLDAPVLIQYARWMGVVPQVDGNFSGIFQGNFGASWWIRKPAVQLIALKLPVTLELGFLSLIIAQLIALPIGVYSALQQDKWGDYIARTFAILCISIPGFWLGTMIIVYPSIWWGYMPPMALIHFTENPIGNLQMFIVPAIVMGFSLGGMTMRMTRSMMLEVMRQDYIRTAWAKGLRERVVITRHALKNALIPVVSVIGLQVPILIGGTVIVEKIFLLPGMGRLLMDAIIHRDEALIRGILVFFSAGLVLINLMVDLSYAYLDPRIHYE